MRMTRSEAGLSVAFPSLWTGGKPPVGTMSMLRKLSVMAVVGVSALTAHASCVDIKASCGKAYQLDTEYCNKQDARSQESCFKRASEALRSCVGSCK